MYPDELDGHIRRQLHDHLSEVDSEALWAQLATRTRRRGGPWWWRAAALVGLALLTGAIGFAPAPSEPPPAEEKAAPAPAKADVAEAPPSVAEAGDAAPLSVVGHGADVRKSLAPTPVLPLPEAGVTSQNKTASLTLAKAAAGATALSPLSGEVPLAPASISPPALPEMMIPATPSTGRSHQLFAAVYTGLYGVNRQLTAATTADEEWKEQKEASTTVLETSSGEINIGLRYRGGWSLRTGLAYSRLTERFEWGALTVKADTVQGIRSITVNEEGDRMLTYGEVTRFQFFEQRWNNNNTLTSWDVPVILSYTLGRRKFSLLAEAGVYFNLQLQARGLMVNAEEEVVDLGANGGYQAQTGVSYHAGLGVTYRVSPQWQLHLLTSLRHFPRSFTENNHPLAEHFQWRGLRLGASYTIGRTR